MNNPIVVIGGGGHSVSVIDALLTSGNKIVGVLDSFLPVGARVLSDVFVIGGDKLLESDLKPDLHRVVLGVGPQPRSTYTHSILKNIREHGFDFAHVRHASAIVSEFSEVSSSAQILAGVIIQAKVFIGDFSVINTGSSLDHGVQVGVQVHIAPRAVLCGDVTVEDGAYIGAGSVLFPGVTVGKRSVIGAGSLVKVDVQSDQVIHGFYK